MNEDTKNLVGKVCHDCKMASNRHKNSRGIPNAYCTKHRCSVLEFNERCDYWTEREVKQTIKRPKISETEEFVSSA